MGSAAVKSQKDRPPQPSRAKRGSLDKLVRNSSDLRQGELPPINSAGSNNPANRALNSTDAPPATTKPNSPILVPPIKIKPLAQPECSCMVTPKYTTSQGKRNSETSSPPGAADSRKSSQLRYQPRRRSRQEEDIFELFSNSSETGNDVAAERGMGQMERRISQNSLSQSMNSNADPNAGEGSSWARDERLSLLLPFIETEQLDEESKKNFMDYLRSHVAESRGHKQHWFNVSFNRDCLQRRPRGSSIKWCPMEEIAVFELEVPLATPTELAASARAPSPVVEVKPPVKGKKQRQQQQKAELQQLQQQQQEQQRALQEPQPVNPDVLVASEHVRTREILSEGLPHRDQLAKKAIEDNALFICARTPSRFR